ncbi:MAG: site-2 protease family protein [Candidatus Saccharimonadales bacterium]
MQNLSATYVIYVIIAILISLVIHEFMHAYVGHLLGDSTAREEGRLTLNPLSHIDPMMTVVLPIFTLLAFGAPVLAAKPVPFNPDRVKYDEFGAALIAAAGPFSNLLLAFVVGIFVKHVAVASALTDFLSVFVTLNIALFVFNLIPIPPLDGSRVLYAFAPESLQRVMRDIEPFGIFIVFSLVLFANFGDFLGNINQAILNVIP